MVDSVYYCGISNKRGYPEIDFSMPPNSEIDWAGFDKLREVGGSNSESSESLFSLSVPPSKTPVDVLRLNADFLVSERTKSLLGSMACAKCEWIPVLVNQDVYYLWMLRTVIDCLDMGRSRFQCFPGNSAKIMAVRKYVFDKSRIPPMAIFKIPQKNKSIFFTPEAKRCVQSSGINGFRFFDIENPPTSEPVG